MRLALAGGGTGGHVVPGLHLLEHLSTRGKAPADVLWFCSGRAVEERVLARSPAALAPFERIALALEPATAGAPSWLRLALRTPPEMRKARLALEQHRSDVLLALGGYTVLPAVLAARALGIPVVLLEINSVRGKATRALGGLAESVVHAWPSSLPESLRKNAEATGRGIDLRLEGSMRARVRARLGDCFSGSERGARHRCFGPPLAPAFLGHGADEAASARERAALGFRPDLPLLLVLGGSQGAAGLNRFVAGAAHALVAEGVQVLHQTGPGRLGEAAAPLQGYRAVEFLDGMARVLDGATLVLSRGGASTLAEIAARRRPALVVPYPHHRDRHQERNALALGAGARIVPEERLDASLVPVLARLAGPEGARERALMSRALEHAVPLDGVERLADELLRVAGRFRTKA